MELSATWRVTPDMLCIIDGEGKFAAVNPAWQRTLGWRHDEMVGHHFSEFVAEEDLAASVRAFETLTAGDPVLRFENRYKTRMGEQRWLAWVAVPEGDHYFCSARDVTDDKRRLEIIQRQRSEAELREQFVAVLGHDLRNPISAIGAGVRMLMRREQDDASAEILSGIQGSADRMAELVDNLMDLARAKQADGLKVERSVGSGLRDVLEQVVFEQRSATGAAIELEMSDLDDVYCDPARIGQLLSNLLANAVLHGDKAQAVRVSATRQADRFMLSVANKGEPIPEEAMRHLFRPFFREKVRQSQNGLGLGLYIASQIAQAHEGELKVASTPAETIFTLDIPAK
ncbi:PAS domain-containing sensor histidine kinase [Sulfitobacter sp. D35]|uniref:PAS domain-containing sensor histidine kinase n=1 Tax=Sulfitobacter sp. D35 TaxID=3083252 RepID=UPI00296E8EA9|nr:PAS domain-containing sensor histidine kinase [Sulfitobacter sp. D35]